MYNNSSPGPTLKLRPGETLRVHLKNELGPNRPHDPTADDTAYPLSDLVNIVHKPNTTNFHTHGLHVSASDVGAGCKRRDPPNERLPILSSDCEYGDNALLAVVRAVGGLGDEALNMLRQMQREGMRPNEVTYFEVLSACRPTREEARAAPRVREGAERRVSYLARSGLGLGFGFGLVSGLVSGFKSGLASGLTSGLASRLAPGLALG